jgi:purine-binding chemotaxis protein CheW
MNADNSIDYVTFTIGGQLFGLPISRVEDVFKPEAITRVPLSKREIAGVLNLRGRIVTAINMRTRLGLEPSEKAGSEMAVGVSWKNEAYGLLIDGVGEVMRLRPSSPTPSIFTRPGSAYQQACFASMAASSSFSISTASSPSMRSRPQHEPGAVFAAPLKLDCQKRMS